jgi:DNA-3-methyladenine glycosylase
MVSCHRASVKPDPLSVVADAKFAPLPRSFYARPAAVVARECLGKILVFEREGQTLAGRIVESEAYLGIGDRAAHSFGGRRTARNEVMYGIPGRLYVFFIYGMHFHLNLVTDAEELPCAVLLRAVEPLLGIDTMQVLRGNPGKPQLLTNGPGKLCQAFAIGRVRNGIDLCVPPLYLSDGPPPKRIQRSARIGVDYAGSWAKRLLRFLDADSAYVSAAPGRRR